VRRPAPTVGRPAARRATPAPPHRLVWIYGTLLEPGDLYQSAGPTIATLCAMSFSQPFAAGPADTASLYRLRVRRQRRGVLALVLGLVLLGICGLLLLGILVNNLGPAGSSWAPWRAAAGRPGGRRVPVDGPVGAGAAPHPAAGVPLGRLLRHAGRADPEQRRELAASSALGDASTAFSAVFVAPWVEEFMKGSFLLGLLVFRRREFDGVLDGIVYAGVVAAGSLSPRTSCTWGRRSRRGTDGQSGDVVAVLIMRGCSPLCHPLFTSMIGIGLGIATNAKTVLAGWPRRSAATCSR